MIVSLPTRRFLMVAILLVATGLRVIGLDNFPTPDGASPPGLEHDEVAHWLINRDILAGNHAIYFTEAYGHEALYHYAQAAMGAAVGDHALALRLPSAYLGVLLVAVAYALGRRLFGARMGLLSAAFLAVLFWPVFYSRLALRAISLPVLSGLSALAWWTAFAGQGSKEPRGQVLVGPFEPDHPSPRADGHSANRAAVRWLLASGILAGLALHTYMAGRAIPIFYALFTLYLALIHRYTFRAYRRGIVLFWLGQAAVALPLVGYLALNPGAEVRIGEVDAPLRSLLSGDARPMLENAVKITGGFFLRGDPLWRQGIARQPVFNPILGLLFFGGVALCIRRWRESRHAFLLLWLVASIVPSLVTIDAPSTIRMINLLPVLMLYPMLAIRALFRVGRSQTVHAVKSKSRRVIHIGPQLSTVWTRLSTDLTTIFAVGTLAILLLYHTWVTANGLWREWPANEEVQFVWQAALTEAAAYLDASADSGPAAVGGWTPETMDPPTMYLTLRREDLDLSFFNPTEALILPNSIDEAARLIRPAILPLDARLEALTGPWSILRQETLPGQQFALYRYESQPEINPAHVVGIDFSDELRFIGYDADASCSDPSAACTLTTYWRVLAPATGSRRLFLHLTDPDGQVIAQDDRLGAPAEYWQPGDVIAQLMTLPNTQGELRLGVYDPATGKRLQTETGEEYLVIRP